MLSCAVYSTIMKYTAPNFFKYRPLKEGELRNLILVSVIFIVNIALSNSSLKFNSLALDQVFFFAFYPNPDVPLRYARFHLCAGVSHLWQGQNSLSLPLSDPRNSWNHVGVPW